MYTDEPQLPVVDLIEMDMQSSEEVKKLISQTRKFLVHVHNSISSNYDEGNHIEVEARLRLLAGILPSASMAKAIATKAFHKRKLDVTQEYLNTPEKKKLGVTIIQVLAKDHCYAELSLMTLADETHADIKTQIDALRSILSTHKAEIEARMGGHQT
jgi:hypothetical protein